MAIDSGLGQFLDFGATTTITASVGKVTGGSWAGDSGAVHREAIGAQDLVTGGPVPIGGSADFMVSNYDWLTYGLRSVFTPPALTDFCVAGGFIGDGRHQQQCKMASLRLSCAAPGPLTASVTWLGLTEAAYTTAPMTYLGTTDIVCEWYTGVVTIGEGSLQCIGMDLTIDNGLEHVWTLDGATTNQKRWPDAIHVGTQNVALSVNVLTRPDTTAWTDILADTIAVDIGASFAFTGGTGGAETFQITLEGLSRFTQPIPLAVGGGMITYALTFEGPNDKSCVSISCS